jgi:hypothetical protein
VMAAGVVRRRPAELIQPPIGDRFGRQHRSCVRAVCVGQLSAGFARDLFKQSETVLKIVVPLAVPSGGSRWPGCITAQFVLGRRDAPRRRWRARC